MTELGLPLIRPSLLIFAVAIACGSACGGRVDGPRGVIGGSGEADSGVGAGMQSTGGRNASGGAFNGTGGQVVGGAFGTGGDVIGSCNPSFCVGTNDGKGCCMTQNGPCGVDYGMGCGPRGACSIDSDCFPPPVPCTPCPDGSCATYTTRCRVGNCITEMNACPAVPAVCTEGFCPPMAGGKGCCLSPIGPCGVDTGMGCEPPCTKMNCFPPDQVFTWRRGCVPSICRDAGPTLPICRLPLGQSAGEPCQSPGELCTETYGCTGVLICATSEGCPIPL